MNLGFRQRYVALFSGVSVAANASLGRVTSKVTGRAVARLHAMIAVEPFRTNLIATIAHPTREADALAVILPAFGVVLAVTLLTTIRSVESVRTDRFAIGSGPARRTLAHPRFVRTLATVFARALQATLRSVRVRRTRMLTSGSDIPRSTAVLPGNVVTGGIAVHRPRAAFLTAMPEEPVRTGLVTIRTGPTPRADALAGDWIAGRIVVTRAHLGTALPVQSHLAAALAADTAPIGLADAFPGRRVTGQRVLQMTVATLRAVLPKPTRVTLLFAPFSGPSRRARALAIHRIADSAVRAVTTLATILAIALGIARSVTSDPLPSRRAEALARLRSARGPILTVAPLATVLTVRSVVALLFAVLSLEAGNAIAGAVDVITG